MRSFFLAAFFLNPAVHDFTLFEVRRIVFGLPFFMLGLYALGNNRRWLLLFGLSFTLLAKESVGFFVFMIGVYLLLFQKDWRWGSFYMVLGAAWVVVISLWVIPSDGSAYPQLYYFEYLGSTYQKIFQNILANPLLLIAPLVQQPEPLLALFRILLPLAFLLPFLEWRWVLIVLPYVGLMFISLDEDMIRLDKWYTTLVMPVLFGAIIMGWGKLRPQWRQPAAWLLLVSSLVGYGLFSPAPLGGRFDPQRYTVTDRHRLALDLLEMIPDDAKVAAQLDYVAHLTHRRDLYHFPWIRIGEENIDYFVVDRLEDPYPFTQQTLNDDIDNKLANPAMIIEAEADGIFVLHQNGRPLPSLSVEATAENVIQLEKVEVAVQDERGVFQTTEAWEKEMAAGSQIRVSLYWRALGDTNRERTVSVRLAEPDGGLLAQHDMLPSNGARPTSWWEEGWYFRDLYYLDLPEDAAGKQATLQVLLYDSFTQDRVPFGEQDAIEIGAVNIR